MNKPALLVPGEHVDIGACYFLVTMVDPKIGFAIICKCRERQQGLEVLSIRRGQSSQAPGKWSFPGGKLALGDDSEEKRILSVVEAQCGGGEPAGLPPLIHIIRLYNETAKVKLCVNKHSFTRVVSVRPYTSLLCMPNVAF